MDETRKDRPPQAPEQATAPGRKRKRRTTAARSGKRTVARGDVPPRLSAGGIRDFTVNESVDAATESKAYAVQDILSRAAQGDPGGLRDSFEAILSGASPDDVVALRNLLSQREDAARKVQRDKADGELAADWREGGYPYKHLMSRRSYERKKYELQVELLKLQAWVKETGQRVVILFEGRDAAGKGGTIKRFMEHLNPRGARVVALEKPSDVERGPVVFPALRRAPADRAARSCCSTAPGTTAPASSG